QAYIGCTGDVLRKGNDEYNLVYYIDVPRRTEGAGAQMMAVKAVAGLLKTQPAEVLILIPKENDCILIALHTHHTTGTQVATYLKAIEAGIDSIDCALASFSGTTSQPSLNAMVALMQGQERENKLNLHGLNQYSNYWEAVREMYYPFESDLKSSTAEVYDNEIPGGQYSNLRQQAEGVGLGDKLPLIK